VGKKGSLRRWGEGWRLFTLFSHIFYIPSSLIQIFSPFSFKIIHTEFKMGQEISVVIDAVDAIDHQEEKKKQAQDALNALVTVAKDKAIIHYQTVISNARDAKLLPIHHVVTTMQQTYCGISKNPAGLKQSIGNAVKNFVKGEIVHIKSFRFSASSL
jgi:hypothetical protein